ncbi:MAG: hypothetical protein V1846_02460 [Candidatus Komeilibacteria bacterium]
MRDADYIVANWPIDKQGEVAAVKSFLDNSRCVFSFTPSNIECHAAEPTDIWVKDINRKFQIVVADFERYELLGKAKPNEIGLKVISFERNWDDVWREYVIKPLRKKNKYGRAANGITLLIDAPSKKPPRLESAISVLRKTGRNREAQQLGFDEIYLVFKEGNIQIYP